MGAGACLSQQTTGNILRLVCTSNHAYSAPIAFNGSHRWHIDATDAMVDVLNNALKAAKEEDVVGRLRERLVTSLSSGCDEAAAVSKKTTVQLRQVNLVVRSYSRLICARISCKVNGHQFSNTCSLFHFPAHDKVAGLWVILGLAVGVALAITVFLFFTRRVRQRYVC
jgi:hypothetical protein